MNVKVNGKDYEINVDPNVSLLAVIRDYLGLTGTRYGCGEAQCAACTVLVDGVAQASCIKPVSSVVGREVTTIEGLAKDGALHPVQQAFLEQDAFQCSYCASGMILGTVSLLREHPAPSEEQIIKSMDKHICRCGTYPSIMKAIRSAATRV